jgi:hypothetical protein
MDAFRFKDGYTTGAGECVSLSTLYAAALFVVAGIPLDDLYLMATPLHSQNFVDLKEGILTNNRRIVTKNMWFNGTELSTKARRALQHERVTVVAHHTGVVHTLYPEATMAQGDYARFAQKLTAFTQKDIDYNALVGFLRQDPARQALFQVATLRAERLNYVAAEHAFAQEARSKAALGDDTQEALLAELDERALASAPLVGRASLNEAQTLLRRPAPERAAALTEYFESQGLAGARLVADLQAFCRLTLRLPGTDKTWVPSPVITLDGVQSAEEARERLWAQRHDNDTVALAFAAARDLSRSPWRPFLKAALERNPVSVQGAMGQTPAQVFARLQAMPDSSIYPEPYRLAQPDEVWNFGRGDGLEKALCLLNILCHRAPEQRLTLDGDRHGVVLTLGHHEFRFRTAKTLALPTAADFGDCLGRHCCWQDAA